MQLLKRLRVLKVNLILLHWSLSKKISLQAYKWLEEIKEEGYTNSIGISNFIIKRLLVFLKSVKIKLAVNQKTRVIGFYKKNQIAVQGYSLIKPCFGLSESCKFKF